VAGALGGTSGADAKCQALADAAQLGGDYKAWLSDNSASAAARMTHSPGAYVLVNGAVVATDFSDLIKGSVRHAIDLSELGIEPPRNGTACEPVSVWTDTRNEGTPFELGYTCGEWTDTNGWSGFGRWNDQANWSLACSGGSCGGTAALYCFEQ
jgi:hypothetical protein